MHILHHRVRYRTGWSTGSRSRKHRLQRWGGGKVGRWGGKRSGREGGRRGGVDNIHRAQTPVKQHNRFPCGASTRSSPRNKPATTPKQGRGLHGKGRAVVRHVYQPTRTQGAGPRTLQAVSSHRTDVCLRGHGASWAGVTRGAGPCAIDAGLASDAVPV